MQEPHIIKSEFTDAVLDAVAKKVPRITAEDFERLEEIEIDLNRIGKADEERRERLGLTAESGRLHKCPTCTCTAPMYQSRAEKQRAYRQRKRS